MTCPPKRGNLIPFNIPAVNGDQTVTVTVPRSIRLAGTIGDSKGNVYPNNYVFFTPVGSSAVSYDQTDGTGRYELDLLAGQYQHIQAQAHDSNFNRYVVIRAAGGGPLTFDSSQTYDIVIPMSYLTISVRDADGDPVADASFELNSSGGRSKPADCATPSPHTVPNISRPMATSPSPSPPARRPATKPSDSTTDSSYRCLSAR